MDYEYMSEYQFMTSKCTFMIVIVKEIYHMMLTEKNIMMMTTCLKSTSNSHRIVPKKQRSCGKLPRGLVFGLSRLRYILKSC